MRALLGIFMYSKVFLLSQQIHLAPFPSSISIQLTTSKDDDGGLGLNVRMYSNGLTVLLLFLELAGARIRGVRQNEEGVFAWGGKVGRRRLAKATDCDNRFKEMSVN